MITYIPPFRFRKHTATSALQCVAVFLCALAGCAISPAQAGWIQPQGKGFLSSSFYYYHTDTFVDNNGRRQSQPDFRKLEWIGYGEYGWRDDITLGAKLFLHQLEADFQTYVPATNSFVSGTSANYGLAEPSLFLRKQWWKGELVGHDAVLAVQPLLKLPSLYVHNRLPKGGTDNFDAELRLQFGMGFTAFERKHAAKLEAGYRHRFGPWRDQFQLDATADLQLSPKWTLMPQLFLTKRVNGKTRLPASSAAVNDYDLLKGQLSLLYPLNDDARLQIGYFSHLYSRNTGGGDGLFAGLFYTF